MGITGLLLMLRGIGEPVHIRDYADKTIAIDAASWLYKGLYGCALRVAKDPSVDYYVSLAISRAFLLQRNNVRPLLVLDGAALPMKAATRSDRDKSKAEKKELAAQLLKDGRDAEAEDALRGCLEVTAEMRRKLVLACREFDIPYIVAPYEADAQLAYLVRNGLADAVITEDSDLLAFGAKEVLFKMDSVGSAICIRWDRIADVKIKGGKTVVNLSNFSEQRFRHMCILGGCDYLPAFSAESHIKGVGIKTAAKYMALCRTIDRALMFLQAKKLVPKGYSDLIEKANRAFEFHVVYDPRTGAQVPLNPYPEGMDTSQMEYAGTIAAPEVAKALARGDINPSTGELYTTPGITLSTLRQLNYLLSLKNDPKSKIVTLDLEESARRKSSSGKSTSWFEDEDGDKPTELEEEMQDEADALLGEQQEDDSQSEDQGKSQADHHHYHDHEDDKPVPMQGAGRWSQFRKKTTTAKPTSSSSSLSKNTSSSSSSSSAASLASTKQASSVSLSSRSKDSAPKAAGKSKSVFDIKSAVSKLSERNQKLASEGFAVGFDASAYFEDDLGPTTPSDSPLLRSQPPSSAKFANPFARSGGPVASSITMLPQGMGLLVSKPQSSSTPESQTNMSKLAAAQRRLLGEGDALLPEDEDAMIQRLLESGAFGEDEDVASLASSEPPLVPPPSQQLSAQARLPKASERSSSSSSSSSSSKAAKRKPDRSAPKLGDFAPKPKVKPTASSGGGMMATSPASAASTTKLSSTTTSATTSASATLKASTVVPSKPASCIPAVIRIDDSSQESLPVVHLAPQQQASLADDVSAANKKKLMAAAFIARMQGAVPSSAGEPRDSLTGDERPGKLLV